MPMDLFGCRRLGYAAPEGRPSSIVVGVSSGWSPITSAAAKKAEVAHEGGVVGLIVSH